MLATGAMAPDFSLTSLSGERQSLSGLLASGPVLLAFYKASCPVCQLTLPYLERLSQGSLRVITISQDGEPDTQRFRSAFKLTLPALLDRAEDRYPASNSFGISLVPSLFLVEPGGIVSMAGSGFHKKELETLGQRAGVAVFHKDDNVPEWKAG